MKRFVLGLIMMGGLALAAAPMANATAPAFCGHNYAFVTNGAEPELSGGTASATVPLNYIVGVGILNFAPSSNASTCTFDGQEIYIDEDYETIAGGPVNCSTITSLEGTVPCFSGSNIDPLQSPPAPYIVGTSMPGPNGSQFLEFGATFEAVIGAGNSADITLPFVYTVFPAAAGATYEGNSTVPLGDGGGPGSTTGNMNPCPEGAGFPLDFPGIGCGQAAPTPPLGPVLSITMQRQQTTDEGSIPTAYGAAPYLGTSAVLCTGFGSNSSDLVAAAQAPDADEATGGYGATSGSLSIFSSGIALGSLTFNTNDDVGNTTGVSNFDCDFEQTPDGYPSSPQVYSNGLANNIAYVYDEFFTGVGNVNPTPSCKDGDAALQRLNSSCTGSGTPYACCSGVGTGTCSSQYNYQCTGSGTPYDCCTGSGKGACNAPIGANEVNSTAVWGASNTSGYTIVTGVASPAVLGGAFLPPGEMATCTTLANSTVPGAVTMLTSPASETDTGPFPQTKQISLKLTNTSDGACTIGAALIPTSSNVGTGTTGTSSPVCSLTLSAPGTLVEGDQTSTIPTAENFLPPWTANCTCTAAAKTNASCTASGVPYGCCTGSHTGTCVAEADNYEIGAAAQSAPTGVPSADCPLVFAGNASGATPETLTCKN